MDIEIFKQVVKANAETLNNEIQIGLENYLAKHKTKQLTEYETRELAVKFFQYHLSDKINRHFYNNL